MSQTAQGGIPGLRPDAIVANHETVEDDYDIHERIGRGSFADVFRATHKVTGAVVAVKRIRKLQMLFGLFRKNKIDMSAEVDVMRKMDHPNIIKLFDVYENRKEVALVMEYAAGGQLLSRVSDIGCCEQTAKQVIFSVLSAIKYMHDNNAVHRDLKPENIVVMGDDLTQVKLTDFGLSKLSSAPMKTFVGTPAYLAPEMLQGNNLQYGKEIDVWAIGVVTHYLLCGQLPFQGNTSDDLYAEILHCRALTFTAPAWQHVTNHAKDFVQNILRADPKQRLTLSNALRHPWLSSVNNNDHGSSSPPSLSSERVSSTPLSLNSTLEMLPMLSSVVSDSDNASDHSSPARVPIPWALQKRLFEDTPSPNHSQPHRPRTPNRSVVMAGRLSEPNNNNSSNNIHSHSTASPVSKGSPLKQKAASMLALRFGSKPPEAGSPVVVAGTSKPRVTRRGLSWRRSQGRSGGTECEQAVRKQHRSLSSPESMYRKGGAKQ